jgi:uncharacterized protein YjiS (DUF1127 family)
VNAPAIVGTNAPAAEAYDEFATLRAAERARAEAVGVWVAGAGRVVGRWLGTFIRRQRERQRIMDELNALDDRMLSDIGIARNEIAFVASGRERLHTPDNDNGSLAA